MHFYRILGREGADPWICSLEGNEREASVHSDVRQGGGVENQAAEGGVGAEEHGSGLPGLGGDLWRR